MSDIITSRITIKKSVGWISRLKGTTTYLHTRYTQPTHNAGISCLSFLYAFLKSGSFFKQE